MSLNSLEVLELYFQHMRRIFGNFQIVTDANILANSSCNTIDLVKMWVIIRKVSKTALSVFCFILVLLNDKVHILTVIITSLQLNSFNQNNKIFRKWRQVTIWIAYGSYDMNNIIWFIWGPFGMSFVLWYILYGSYNMILTPIWGILGTELASFLDKKSRVTFSVLMTSYLTESFLFHNNLKLR